MVEYNMKHTYQLTPLERVIKLLRVFIKKTNTKERFQDLALKVNDLTRLATPKNIADVVMSAMWLEVVARVEGTDLRPVILLNQAAAAQVMTTLTITYRFEDPASTVIEMIKKRLLELEERFKKTGSLLNKK